MCCIEGDGSYSVIVNDTTLKKGGEFEKTEYFDFKFQTCMNDNDCNDYNIRTNSYCKENINTCLYFPKPCAEYGAMATVNVTTFNFPETVSWVVQNEDGIDILKGGPYELSKYIYTIEECFEYGTYQLINTGSDLFGYKLRIVDEYALEEEYVLPGASQPFTIESPTLVTTSSTPTISYEPTAGINSYVPSMFNDFSPTESPSKESSNDLNCNVCEDNQSLLLIKFMADSRSHMQNKIIVERFRDFSWYLRSTYENFISDELNIFSKCLDKSSCYRFIITDTNNDGICCDFGKGWFQVYWNGKNKLLMYS